MTFSRGPTVKKGFTRHTQLYHTCRKASVLLGGKNPYIPTCTNVNIVPKLSLTLDGKLRDCTWEKGNLPPWSWSINLG